MRVMSKLLLATVGAASLGGAALAADHAIHGKAAPPAADAPVIAFVPMNQAPVAMADPFDDPMFADMRQQMAEMDARMAAMMRMAGDAQADGGAPGMVVSVNGMPAGSVSYSYVSTSTGANGCTQTVAMSSTGDGAKPKIVRTSAGDCGTGPADTSAATKMVSDPAQSKPAPAPKVDRSGNI